MPQSQPDTTRQDDTIAFSFFLISGQNTELLFWEDSLIYCFLIASSIPFLS